MKRLTISALVLFVLGAASLRAAEDAPLSAAPAATLKGQLEQLKLDVIAAPDPEEPGRYIAALHIPRIQLLVISAPYAPSAAIDGKIAAGQYMDVYVQLQSVRDRTGHFFVEDVLADGLSAGADPQLACDTTTVDGATSIVFNGNWPAQQLTHDQYIARLKRDDERYARMLTVLTTALTRRMSTP